MLGWSITFFIVALIAAFFGFSGIAVASTEIAKILFAMFLILFIITAIISAIRGKTKPGDLV